MRQNINITNTYAVILILMINFITLVAHESFAQNNVNSSHRTATIYTIYNVKIDETSRNVTTARDAALINGQRYALERLFRRIILKADREKLPSFSNAEITDFISGFEINDERRSGVRYLASLVVHINRNKVHDILNQYEIPYAETLGTAVSILPVLEEAGTLTLWGKNNGWRLAWKNYDVINNLVPINTPEPSLKNRMYISALQAKNNIQKTVGAYIKQNNLNELIIATATVNKNIAQDELRLDISFKINNASNLNAQDDTDRIIYVKAKAYDEFGNLNLDELYFKGVEATTDWIDDLWKSKILVKYGEAAKITASGSLNQLNDWLTIAEKLKQVNLIRNVDLLNLTINKVDIQIEFAGDAEQLTLSLAQQGLILNRNDNQTWSLIINEDFADLDQN